MVIYQCARELLFNLIKHAKARRGAIALRASGDRLELAVEDGGVGFAGGVGAKAADARGGYGLYSIGERLAVLGGRIDVWSGPQGSRVALSVPIAAPAPAAPRQDPQAPAPPGEGAPNP